MTFNVGQLTQRMQALYPEGQRSPAELLPLVRSLNEAWPAVRAAFDEYERIPGVSAGTVQARSDADAFTTRLAFYTATLEGAAAAGQSEAETWPAVRPLLVRVLGPDPITGKRLHVIDAVFPFSFQNQIDEIATTVDHNSVMDAVAESVEELPERIGRGAAKVGEIVGETAGGIGRGFLAGLGSWIFPVAALGVAYWAITKGKSNV